MPVFDQLPLSLQVASEQPGALTRRESTSLCRVCGCPLLKATPDTATIINLPLAAIRRSCRRSLKMKKTKGQTVKINRASIVITCRLCNEKALKPYTTLKAASEALNKGTG